MTLSGYPGDSETSRQLFRRWSLSAVFVLAMHGSMALAIVHWPQPESPAGEPPAAVMIELAPLPVAPEAVPQEVAVGVLQEMSENSTPTDAKDDPVEEIEEPKTEPTVTPETDVPELPKMEKAEAVLETPPERQEPKPVEEKKPEEPEKKAEKKKVKPKPKSVAQTASAPKPVDAARAKTNAAPNSGVGASMSIATWRGTVMAHLNRRKRHPGGAARGTASVAFTIDRAGRVLSARLIRSSGSAALDQEATALARRASPVPAPPANMGASSITLTVPVRFSR